MFSESVRILPPRRSTGPGYSKFWGRPAFPSGVPFSDGAQFPGSSAVPGLSGLGEVRASPEPVAIVGLACRFPDADDLASLFQVITTGRRAFRRIPPCRVDLADYYSSDPTTPDATYSTRAALLEGWRFDRVAFGISQATYASGDPAQWLAIETAARTLTAAGFPGGTGLPGERAGAFIGTAAAGDMSRASALRLHWPYARQVLADALFAARAPKDLADQVLAAAATRYLAPFAPVTAETVAGAAPGTIASAVCALLGFRGGGYTIDAGGASSLAAIAAACAALVSGELDVAIAGGVDVSLDPVDLVGLAKSGVLAASDVRIYDQNPTGFLPGEGCGLVLLVRSADAVAAGLPVYAEIGGWGMAAADQPRRGSTDQAGLLLAMRKAYQLADIDPADVGYIEGCGSGVGHADEAEVAALATLLDGRRRPAVLGAITASIGHTRAAAGAAGLIKTVLAATHGVLPAATGVTTPHERLRDAGAVLRTPAANESWTDPVRRAGVSARDADGFSVHLVLSHQPKGRDRPGRSPAEPRESAPGPVGQRRSPPSSGAAGKGRPSAFLVQAADRAALTAILSRIAEVARWLSDAQLDDLACQLAAEAADQGKCRVAIVATRQEQLSRLASEAITILPTLAGRLVTTQPGIFAADDADGRVALLLSGQPLDRAESPDRQFSRALRTLSWLDELGVTPATAVGRGLGELAGLVWARCLSPAEATALNGLRASALKDPADPAAGNVRQALDAFTARRFEPPTRPYFAGSAGTQVSDAADASGMLSAELLDAATYGRADAAGRLAEAVLAATAGASLLLQSGRDRELTRAIGRLAAGHGGAGQRRKVAVVTIDGDPADSRCLARAAAALFAAGALGRPEVLYAGHPARPIDIWQEQIFITSPSQARPPFPADQADGVRPPGRRQARGPAGDGLLTGGEPDQAGCPGRFSGTSHGDDRAQVAGIGLGGRAAEPTGRAAEPTGRAAEPGAASEVGRRAAGPVIGARPWTRCYSEQRREPADQLEPGPDGPWQVYTGGCESLVLEAYEPFRHEASAERTLAVLGSTREAGTVEAALLAARSAITTGQLVTISPDPGLSGLWASLHAEHRRTGIVAVRAALTPETMRAASRIGVVPGQHRELAIEPDGSVRELVMAPLAGPAASDFPVGASDVVLISRSAGAPGLALAQVLACSGAALVIIGRDPGRRDDQVTATLEELRLAGVPVGYEIVSPASGGALTAALGRIEQRFGKVTAVAHATGVAPPRAVYELTRADSLAFVADQTRTLDQLVTAVRSAGGQDDQLRLIMTFGSVAGRYGLAGGGLVALATAALASLGSQLAAVRPGCRALHVDWPGWADPGLGQRLDWTALLSRAGYAPVSMQEGSRQLLRLMALADRPARIAVHGRVGTSAPRPIALTDRGPSGASLAGRFVRDVLVHYPGVELVTTTGLSPATDPYLADYQIDGVGLLPPGIAVEAMTQVAERLTGSPSRTVAGLKMAAPIVLSGSRSSAVLRICAVRSEDGSVSAVVRCDNTGYAVDHFSAVFSSTADEQPGPAVSWPEEVSTGPEIAALGAADIYGPVCFQAGQFSRLSAVRLARSQSATAVADGLDGSELVLGPAGLADAMLQLVQICLPHRRLLFAACERAELGEPTGPAPLILRAVQRPTPAPSVPSALVPLVPQARAGELTAPPASGQGETSWDVEAVTQDGQLIGRLGGLVMRDAGPLHRSAPWPATLAGCLLERVAADSGLGPDLEVRMGQRRGGVTRERGRGRPAERKAHSSDSRAARAPATVAGGWAHAAGGGDTPPGMDLAVRSAGPVACAWQLVTGLVPAARAAERDEAWLATVDAQRLPGADAASLRALARSMAACAGRVLPPPDLQVEVRAVAGTNWLLAGSGSARITATLLDVAGIGQPVAVAIRTGTLRPAPARTRTRAPAASRPR